MDPLEQMIRLLKPDPRLFALLDRELEAKDDYDATYERWRNINRRRRLGKVCLYLGHTAASLLFIRLFVEIAFAELMFLATCVGYCGYGFCRGWGHGQQEVDYSRHDAELASARQKYEEKINGTHLYLVNRDVPLSVSTHKQVNKVDRSKIAWLQGADRIRPLANNKILSRAKALSPVVEVPPVMQPRNRVNRIDRSQIAWLKEKPQVGRE
ncbi:hypothetical protein AB0F85_15040 [Nocardia fluminea]|uniref:hypothetical protein n=1 Tax=Nocardia fluminea TaxID=134984 RepID=UPI0033FA4D0E